MAANDPRFSPEELACFSELFSSTNTKANVTTAQSQHLLSVTTEIPQVIASILGKAKLTLLAEVGPYKLWFPLHLRVDDFGQFHPELGVPEVLDTSGAERSWRLSHAQDVWIYDDDQGEQWSVVSLSSSGMAICAKSACQFQQLLGSKNLQLQLPEGSTLKVDIEAIRNEKGLAIVKFHAEEEEREALRQFLFNRHRRQHAHLYRDLRTSL